MKRTSAVLVPLLMARAMTLTSAQSDIVVTAVGFQFTSCGTWTDARAHHQSTEMEFWALGFVTGANVARYADDKFDILKGVADVGALFSWIDSYCRSKPLELFPVAATYLVIELRGRAH
jgi:hypothetical protein